LAARPRQAAAEGDKIGAKAALPMVVLKVALAESEARVV
jgi:hypothetical protein